jgi:hypothetical protein
MSLPKTKDGLCSKCGSPDMQLVEDRLRYSSCFFEEGKWKSWPGGDDPSGGEDSVRFFCPECGEYHEVPEELS